MLDAHRYSQDSFTSLQHFHFLAGLCCWFLLLNFNHPYFIQASHSWWFALAVWGFEPPFLVKPMRGQNAPQPTTSFVCDASRSQAHRLRIGLGNALNSQKEEKGWPAEALRILYGMLSLTRAAISKCRKGVHLAFFPWHLLCCFCCVQSAKTYRGCCYHTRGCIPLPTSAEGIGDPDGCKSKLTEPRSRLALQLACNWGIRAPICL